MNADLISKKTRNRFREALVGFTLQQIDRFFQEADLHPSSLEPPPEISGQRRRLVEQYYAYIDWTSPSCIRRVASVYDSVIEHLHETGYRGGNADIEAAEKTIQSLASSMINDGFTLQNGRFSLDCVKAPLVTTSLLVTLTEVSITEHIEKAHAKINSHDYAGAITSSYTLVESFLKQILQRLGIAFNQDEGDIRQLYQLVTGPLNLSPKGENLESFLKSILQGLKSQLMGLYELANKGSDRHARRYNPARHHAKLAVNTAFSLCEFLLESYEYQQQRSRKTGS